MRGGMRYDGAWWNIYIRRMLFAIRYSRFYEWKVCTLSVERIEFQLISRLIIIVFNIETTVAYTNNNNNISNSNTEHWVAFCSTTFHGFNLNPWSPAIIYKQQPLSFRFFSFSNDDNHNHHGNGVCEGNRKTYVRFTNTLSQRKEKQKKKKKNENTVTKKKKKK